MFKVLQCTFCEPEKDGFHDAVHLHLYFVFSVETNIVAREVDFHCPPCFHSKL